MERARDRAHSDSLLLTPDSCLPYFLFCLATISSSIIGIYNVATFPGSQRRGFGEVVMRHALDEARKEHGIDRLVLQSTPAGLRLYERMGFRTVTRVAVYSS